LGDNVLTEAEILIDLPGYQLTGIEKVRKTVRIRLRYTELSVCPNCGAAERAEQGMAATNGAP